MRSAWVLGLVVACGTPPAGPAPIASPALPERTEPPAPTRADDHLTDALLAEYPSLAHYPAVPAALVAGLRAREARSIFAGLVEAFAPTRWANADDWQRLAHIRILAPAGFCRSEAGAPIPLPAGTYDLGCFGGFLEGVRMLYLPRLELDALVACDPPQAFESCAEGAHAGRAALLQIAARLPAEALPAGITLLDLPADAGHPALVPALARDALHLCTVSHRARARDGLRMYHHMMILDPITDRIGRIRVFDTTGAGGVAFRPMRPERLHNYVHRLLALNDTYRYDPESARLTCLAVARPESLAPRTGP